MSNKKKEEEDKKEKDVIVYQPVNYYAPSKAVKVFQNKWSLFGSIGLFYYILNFILIVYALNSYADGTMSKHYKTENTDTRLLCGRSLLSDTFEEDTKLRCPARLTGRYMPCAGKVGEDASEVLDTAILLLIIFHFVEFMRYTIFLTSIFVGVNLIQVYYALVINSLFGFAVYIFVHIVRFSEDGKHCSEQQKGRGRFLIVAIVCFWLFFWVQINPGFFLGCMSRGTIVKALKESDAEDDSDDGKEVDVKID